MTATKPSVEEKLFTVAQVAAKLQINKRTFWRMVNRGEFPRPYGQGSRLVRVPAADLQAYLDRLHERREQGGCRIRKGELAT